MQFTGIPQQNYPNQSQQINIKNIYQNNPIGNNFNNSQMKNNMPNSMLLNANKYQKNNMSGMKNMNNGFTNQNSMSLNNMNPNNMSQKTSQNNMNNMGQNNMNMMNQNNMMNNMNNQNSMNLNNMNNNMNMMNQNNMNNMSQNNMSNNGNMVNNPMMGNNNMGMGMVNTMSNSVSSGGMSINNSNDMQNPMPFQTNPFANPTPFGQESMSMNNQNNQNNNNDQNLMNQICDTHIFKLSKYYDYKPSEATNHLNSLLRDIDNFGEITKNKIEQEKASNPNKFISIQEALSYNNQNNMMNNNMMMNNNNNMMGNSGMMGNNMMGNNMMGNSGMMMGNNMMMNNNMPNNNPQNDFFILSVLKTGLECEGCTCEIERDFPQFNEEKEFYTAIQFIVNGMYKFKKYKFTFDFGEEKNKTMFSNLIVQNDFNNNLVKNLTTILNLTKKDIVLSNPRQGSYQISAIIKKSNFNELTDIQLFNQLKNNPDYVSLMKVEKTILLNGCKLNRIMLDSRGDRSSGWGVGEMRGGRPYNPPLGWIGYGLRVVDRYDGGNNTWLDFNNSPGEWSVAYHGLGSSLSGQIEMSMSMNMNQAPNYNNLLKTGMRQQFKNEMDKYHSGQIVGEGVYMTQYPNILEQFSQVYNVQGKKYKIGIMCRVMPDKIRCPMSRDDYWVINGTDNEVRPYRILIKEVM